MSAIAASPDASMAAPPPAVKHSVSDTLGVYKLAKGMVYYPLQWLAGVSALYVLDGFNPSVNAVNKVMAVRAAGVAANTILGDGIKNGVPFDLGIKFHKTPTEHLYSLDLAKYAYQRTAYAASATMCPLLFAVGMTLAMPYTAPLFMSLGGALTSAAGATSALGGLGTAAAAHSSILGGAVGLVQGAAGIIGAAMQAWPAAFAMKEGVTVAGMVMSTAQKVFLVNLVAGAAGDILGLEKLNPNHKHKATRGEAPAR